MRFVLPLLLVAGICVRAFEPEDLQALVFTDPVTSHRYKRVPAMLACMVSEVAWRVRELNPMSYTDVLLKHPDLGETARRAFVSKMSKWVPPVRLLSKAVPVFFPDNEPAVTTAVYRSLARFAAAATKYLQDELDGYAFASETDTYVAFCIDMIPGWTGGCRECARDSHGYALRESAEPVKQPVVVYCTEVVPGSEEICTSHSDHSVLRCARSRACRSRPGTGDFQCICV